jgi:sodium transport system permease protein
MRWSVVRLIWYRDLRDQLRDRRTILMIVVLPILLYPVLGTAVMHFAVGFADKPSVVGVVGGESLPPVTPVSAGLSPLPSAAWFSLTPAECVTPGGGIAGSLGSATLAYVAHTQLQYPPLLIQGRFSSRYFDDPHEVPTLRVKTIAGNAQDLLDAREIDAILLVPPDFCSKLEDEARPQVELAYRESDERSRLAVRRLYGILAGWRQHLREVRVSRRGLSATTADPLEIVDPERSKPADEIVAEGLLGLLVRIFPFLLVMWSLAGALYPAVDLCAGEKERGTMETLLISPASREEIVWGKFLTIWVFSAATALLNLASMGSTTWHFSGILTHEVLRPMAIFWCVVLALPLSAFFSAISLAIGAYARSSKEGQYYLMPLFLVTMPLVFLTLAPGVELNPFYSLVPVTGVALLMQRLMTTTLDKVPWLYFVPVLFPVVLYSWLALRWAIEQFKREEVLFREAERLELRLWLRRLFREKEALPSVGQAFFCFALIVALRWLTFNGGTRGSLVVNTGIAYLAFVIAPPLFMALLLTLRPRQALALALPSPRALLAAVVFAALLLPPMSQATLAVLHSFPGLQDLLSQRQPLVEELRSLQMGEGKMWWRYLLVFALMGAVCEELAFRGFILSGLARRFQPWTAILLSSLLFALYHMNVFQLVPAFILGVVLGLLTIRSGSVVPAVVLHLLNNSLLITVPAFSWFAAGEESSAFDLLFHPVITVSLSLLALVLLAVLGFGLSPKSQQLQSADEFDI